MSGLPVDGQLSDQLIAALSDAGATVEALQLIPLPQTLERGHRRKPWERYAEAAPARGHGHRLSSAGRPDRHNHHVVADCAEVRVRPAGQDAMAGAVVARDAGNDLALLKAPVRLPVAEIGDARGIRAGDSVVAVGFPLPGLLASEANVTTGTVSALAGIGDDTRFLQMTVPVQPGNSGGPLLDLEGRVVGVVVGKLDAVKVASVTGDIPQNVNFAIKAGVLRSFLDASAVGVAHRDPLAEPAYPITLSPASVGPGLRLWWNVGRNRDAAPWLMPVPFHSNAPEDTLPHIGTASHAASGQHTRKGFGGWPPPASGNAPRHRNIQPLCGRPSTIPP